MSRHIQKTGTKTIAYGFDPMPGGGYFFQVFDTRFITDENDEGIVINEGFFNGQKSSIRKNAGLLQEKCHIGIPSSTSSM